jgi:carbon-monoxide dehydrogenase large subunit
MGAQEFGGARYFGAAVRRVEDPALITGKGQYVDDLPMPGVAHIAFVRSPHAHARIKSIDLSAAKAARGFVAAYTWETLGAPAAQPSPQFSPAPVLKQDRTQYALAKGAVHYVGEAVAMVIAETRALAEDAAELVAVDYDVLPVMADWRKAKDPGAPLAHEGAPDNVAATLKLGWGDCDAVFAGAAHVFKERLTTHRGGCHSMECRGVLARYDEIDQKLQIWSSTQVPHMLRRFMAKWLGWSESQIRVAAPDVGGGFGPKAGLYAEEYATALAAVTLKRPLKWIEDRREHFLATNQQRDQQWDLEVAVDANGRMLAMRGYCLHDNGAYLPYGPILGGSTLSPFPGPYALEACALTLDMVFTNLVPNTPVRGAGRPNACFVMERMADLVAQKMGLDRAEVRRRSFIRKDQFPYKTGGRLRDGSEITYDSGDYHMALDSAVNALLPGFRERQAELRKQGRYIGFGLASCTEDTGIAPFEGATVKVQPNGKVVLSLGAAAQGQGHKTVFSQIVADRLGVKIEDISVVAGDTAGFPLGIGTIGSRVTATAGPSVFVAANQVREKAVKVAAATLEAKEEEIDLFDGFAGIPGTNRRIPLGEIALRLDGFSAVPTPLGLEPGLASTHYYNVKLPPFAFGTNVCEVEVDIETGEARVTRYVVAHDCGTIINPMLVDGQIRGGVVHGIGNALYERMVHDENGNPLTTNYGEYLLPIATEMPRIEIIHHETPSPLNPLGVKGAGEGGTIPAANCVISAVEDALSPFGARIRHHPISPMEIVKLVEAGR